jgi:hypothetical protein
MSSSSNDKNLINNDQDTISPKMKRNKQYYYKIGRKWKNLHFQ